MNAREAFLVIDLGFGDAGKGTVVDYLTRRHHAHTVVRFNGGPQAAHNVVTPDGRHHTFAQFGAGSFVPGVRTVLSRFVLVEPYALLNEAGHLASVGVPDALARLTVDGRSPVITPCHQAANRLRELARGGAAHGTCGMGVGETVADLVADPSSALYARDLGDRGRIVRVMQETRNRKLAELRHAIDDLRTHPAAASDIATLSDLSWLDAAVDVYAAVARRAKVPNEAGARDVVCDDAGGAVVFEGAQGVLLDEWHGFHPYTTWSTTTFANADTVLDEAGFDGRRTRIGVLRTYATRHGPGPFPAERPMLRGVLPEPHNGDAGRQGRFRVGTFDAVAARYAIAVAGGVDTLALTHVDRLPVLPRAMCTAYREAALPPEPVNELFVRRSGTIVDIRVGPPRDLDRQQRLTDAIVRCAPIESEVRAMTTDDFVGRVEEETACNVGLLSAGPTARDKVERETALDAGARLTAESICAATA